MLRHVEKKLESFVQWLVMVNGCQNIWLGRIIQVGLVDLKNIVKSGVWNFVVESVLFSIINAWSVELPKMKNYYIVIMYTMTKKRAVM